ncbi:c-type cytochrome [Lacimicrobium alkaliphilum]|uniref:Cytochrome C n=1 Tax=Lacimicrobium alkaliphilum TaxID=1526571 RepID=A0A0U3B602_9ALTE|nr:c-type cytochrome [Lacimicrobium alkaliphilum]ALS97093.1 cytochrome C [Lacimicrobium alkaliphilum]
MRNLHLIAVTTALLLTACTQGPESPRGFSLPEGDPQAGEAVFIAYQCLACHTMQGFEDTDTEQQLAKRVPLGGDVKTIKTYAELVTSVINPSHKIAPGFKRKGYTDEQGQSKMRNYNDVMTVTEMTNLVAFLQPKYNLKPFNRTNYPQYFP